MGPQKTQFQISNIQVPMQSHDHISGIQQLIHIYGSL